MFNYLLGIENKTQTIIMLVLLAVMIIVLIVLPMFTNKRRNKAINDLHSALRPGDVIKTVGGVVGTIIEIKDISPVDKEMVIETGVGDNKSTMVFDVQAVYQIISKADAPASEPFAETETKDAPAAAESEKAADPVVANETPAEEKAEVKEEAKEEPVAEVVPEEQAKSEEAATAENPAPAKKPAATRKPRSTAKK